ncbi:MAG TPA: hypothetical protein VJ904_13310 [Tichowtungia sp.]|nr:hypothetical protein [Tichowtungia sp.]
MIVIVLVLTVVVSFKVVAGALTGRKGRSFLVLVPGFVLMLAGAAAARSFFSESLLWQVIAAALVLLFIVLPLTQAVQETSYLSSVLVWTVVLLTVVTVFHIEPTVKGGVQKMVSCGSVLKQHRTQSEQSLLETGR